jgi:uncharacterized protein
LAAGALGVSREEEELLTFACRHHGDGMVDAGVGVQTCRDADRLDLGRVGIAPDPEPCARARRAELII